MADPIRIPLSDFHRLRVAALDADIATLQSRKNEMATTIVGIAHNPVELAGQGYAFSFDGDAILCSPPMAQPVRAEPSVGEGPE